MYRNIPEFNKTCIRASRERAYQKHMDALRNIKSTIPNSGFVSSKPKKTRVSRAERSINYTDSPENEQSTSHARPYTLHGKLQKDEVRRINYENFKVLRTVQGNQPGYNRNTWMLQKIDSDYQVAKNSEFLRTIPMNEMLEQELSNTYKPRRATTAYSGIRGSSTSRTTFSTKTPRIRTQKTNLSINSSRSPFNNSEANHDISDFD